jgi:hypothetical protein
MKSTTPGSTKKRNVSNNLPDKITKGTSKKSAASTRSHDHTSVSVNELFLHFTANIIKEDTLFTR